MHQVPEGARLFQEETSRLTPFWPLVLASVLALFGLSLFGPLPA